MVYKKTKNLRYLDIHGESRCIRWEREDYVVVNRLYQGKLDLFPNSHIQLWYAVVELRKRVNCAVYASIDSGGVVVEKDGRNYRGCDGRDNRGLRVRATC